MSINSIARMREAMAGNMRVRIIAKQLAPNDNSKNQVYLGGDFSALNIIPHAEIETDERNMAGSKRDRAKAAIRFSWLTHEGIFPAPEAKLILYPRYPEVRLSGFLKDANLAPSELMTSRDEGRVLFIGIRADGHLVGYVVDQAHPLAVELRNIHRPDHVGIFVDLGFHERDSGSSRSVLLSTLCAVHNKNWIPSTRLDPSGKRQVYRAANGGGYTLEAELGITPNSLSEPDFLGWEVKQFGVNNFEKLRAKSPVTLMTPEPNGGIYYSNGAAVFVEKFGYADRSGKQGRINFGGIYLAGGEPHLLTGLRLEIDGYDLKTGVIMDMSGGLQLLTRNDEVAAKWNFPGLISHWNRKHEKAVYVPSIKQDNPLSYRFGRAITLCNETDFLLFLKAIASGAIYLDPALKTEIDVSGKTKTKRRNQFRIRQEGLSHLYRQYAVVDACTGL